MHLRSILVLAFVSLFMEGYSQSSFTVFFEKTYVATDRDYYAAGEDIWLQAYLVNAQTNVRTNTSTNLYLELISPDAQVVSQEILHLQNGLAKGDFALPPDAAAGVWRIRAYTNWMKNFGSLFFFEKAITVAADATVKTTIPRQEPILATAINNTTTVGTNHFYFFPEGGNMVAGLPAHVACKATDANGKGISTKGKIVSAAGDSVAAFETTPSGFSSFYFTPVAGVAYTAKGKYYGRELFTENLPPALASGYVLSVKEEANAFVVKAAVDKVTAAANRPAYIIVRHRGKKCFSDSLLVQTASTLFIPKDSLPAGLCAISLYDADNRPQCERLIFSASKRPVQLSLTTSQPSYNGRDSATVALLLTNSQGQPVAARLSLSVTDAGLIETSRHNIASYLLLESEIKGEIENPDQYFDRYNPNRTAALDLLLQTQGWRSFLWRRLRDTSVVIKYLPEPGLTLAGRVRRSLVNQGIGNMNITLYAGKSAGDKLFFTKTQPDGRFFLDGLPLYGPQNIKLTVRNDKNKKEGMIYLDSVLTKRLPVQPWPNLVYDTSATTANFWRSIANRNNAMKDQTKRAAGDLGNVTVKADPIKKEQIQERGMKFGRADSLFNIQSSDARYETLARFILQRYPGAYSDAESNGFFFYGDRFAKILPRWVVDGQEDRFSTGSPFDVDDDAQAINGSFERIDYYNIPISKVKKVYIQPMVSRTGSLLYVVHLSLLPGAFETGDLSQILTQINGYYEARQYFVPSFAAGANNMARSDLRSTIFWAPEIKTDAAGKAIIGYRNSDAKTNIRVRVEGLTDTGEPVVAEMKYEVK